MGLVERRIGLLFAVFLAMLLLAGGRAGWLGLVEGRDAQAAAATQQVSDIAVPARRGTIMDRNGVELAVSRPAVTIAATPYLVEDPAKVAARLAPLLRRHEDDLLRRARPPRHGLRLPRPPRAARRAPARCEQLGLEGLEFIPEFRREYPRTLDGVAGARQRRRRGARPGRPGVPLRRRPRRARRRAPAGQGRARRPDRAARHGPRRSAAGPSASRSTRTSRTRRRPCSPRWGATGGPRAPPRSSWIRARARSSPSPTGRASTRTSRTRRRPTRCSNRATGVNYEPGSTFKAITVAARAGGEHGHARHRVDAPADASAWPTA